MDTFVSKSKDCDGQEIGVWSTKSWESYRTIVSEMFNKVGSEFDSVISLHRKGSCIKYSIILYFQIHTQEGQFIS